jgi:hypothetical protein
MVVKHGDLVVYAHKAIEYLTCSFGYVLHLVMNFAYLRSSLLKLFTFCLDSCIVNKGEKFVHILGSWEHLEGVQSGSGRF